METEFSDNILIAELKNSFSEIDSLISKDHHPETVLRQQDLIIDLLIKNRISGLGKLFSQ
nr:hypothetical protein [uncultured Chryseobacterium sp.]